MAREMKDSGQSWLGAIPKDWHLVRGKYLFRERGERGNKIQLQLLSPTQKYGVIPQDLYEELSGMKAVKLEESVDYAALKAIYEGDFCISLRSFQGGFEYSAYNGVVSPAYHVFYKTENINNAYYRFLFKERCFIDKMASLTRTFRDGKSISFSDFAASLIPVPPLSEQESIAAFLDTECARIDKVIEQTRVSIEEYKKLRRSVITEAVTKGILPNRKMKVSGIEWIDAIPADWKIISIGTFFEFVGGYAFSSEKFIDHTSNQVLRIGNVKDDYLRLDEKAVFIDDEYAQEANSVIALPNDILFTMTGTKGKQDYFYTVLVSKEDVAERNLYINQRVGCFRAKEQCNMQYFDYLLKVQDLKNFIFLYETGTANQGNLGITTIRKVRLLVPPIAEQDTIVEYLSSKCKKIDYLITEKEKLIGEIESYKKSFIYEYVTGKKEV